MWKGCGCQILVLSDICCSIQYPGVCPLIVFIKKENIWFFHRYFPCYALLFPCLSSKRCPKVYSVMYKNKKNTAKRPVNPMDCKLGFCTPSNVKRAMPAGFRSKSHEFQRRKRPM